METTEKKFILFTLDEQHYALRLSDVERVVRAVEVTPLPKAPEIVLGVINMQGRVIPVVNVRKRFDLPEHETDLRDQLIIANTSRRQVALAADTVGGVVECEGETMVCADSIVPGTGYLEGILKSDGGIVLIHDLDTFLSFEEEDLLDDAMREAQ